MAMPFEAASPPMPGSLRPAQRPSGRSLLGGTPLARRLGLHRREPSAHGDSTRAVLARTAFYLLSAGATATLLSLLFDAGPERDSVGVAASAGAAYLLALVCIVGWDRLQLRAFHAIAVGAVALVSAGLYFGGPASSYYRLFYVWIALFAAYHFSMRAAAGQIAAIGVGYGLVVGFLDTEAGPIAWLLTVGTLVVIAVITGLLRRRVETQLAETLAKNERLIEADRLKDEFLATISHELRTPLTSIRGYLDLTLEDEERRLSSEQRSFLEVIDRNSARLLQQVTDLLLVAQIQAGTISVDRRQLDLAELGEAAIGRHGTAASAHGVSLSLETLPLQPVAGDPTRIAQLLDVLLSNAIKFTPDGGSVRLQIRPVAEGVEIEVADTGVGVADSDRQRLFERFYRASGVTDRAVPGTGIGLTIARGIAEAHDGSIECTSVEGVGSTFRVVLPSGGAR